MGQRVGRTGPTGVTNGIVTEIRVRYAETDAMGIVYYANYLVWFELGRTEWIRAHGLTYRELEEGGIRLPVVEAHCTYRASARYDDLVRLETTVTALTPVRVSFAYRATRAAPSGSTGDRSGVETLLVEGHTDHVFLTHDGRIARLTRFPHLWQPLTAAFAGAKGEG